MIDCQTYSGPRFINNNLLMEHAGKDKKMFRWGISSSKTTREHQDPMISTEAWVLYHGPSRNGSQRRIRGELLKEKFSFPNINYNEALVEPIYGCWEGNMTHALTRDPIDICQKRGENKVVIGNAGVVRVLKTGTSVKSVKEGDFCLVFCNGVWDSSGYPLKIFGYDAPGTIGVLAKRMKLHERQLIAIPKNTQHSLKQWAAFSLRYITAWANWKVAYGSWCLHGANKNPSMVYVWGWSGGVTFAELTLAHIWGCQVTMLSANEKRLQLIANSGFPLSTDVNFLISNLIKKDISLILVSGASIRLLKRYF